MARFLVVMALLLALPLGGCKKQENKAPRVSEHDCERLCKKITACGPSMVDVLMAGKSFESDTVKRRAMRAFTNEESCTKSCIAHIRHPKKGKTYSSFVAAQLPCLEEEACVDFAKCIWKATSRMAATYPIDKKYAYLCREVCKRQKRCSKALLKALAGREYTSASPEEQAEMERRMERERDCEIACRRHVIEEGKLDPFATKSGACLNQDNCDEYAKCILEQIPSGP